MSFRELISAIVILGGIFYLGGISSRQYDALHGDRAEFLPVKVAAKRIQRYADNKLPSCFSTLQGSSAALTKAIVAVEFVSLNSIENKLEWMIMKTMVTFHLPIPNLSVGPGQVRPKTVQEMQIFMHANRPPESLTTIALELLDDCKNIILSEEIVSALILKLDLTVESDDLIPVIAAYNGQTQKNLEGIIYNRIVESIYSIYSEKPDKVDTIASTF